MAAFLSPASENPARRRAVVVFTNSARDSLRVYYGPCDFGVRLYPNPVFIGAPLWDKRVDSCDAVLLWLDVPPGESRTKPMFAYVDHSAVGKQIRSGRYHAAVTWRPNPESRVRMIAAGTIDIP
jgi:hypothetical protein